MNYNLSKILISKEAREDPLTKKVLSRLKEIPAQIVDSGDDPLRKLGASSSLSESNDAFSVGKTQLLLTRYKGDWLRACPGTSQHVCCNLWTVNPGEGCPLDCTYCYLQSYLKRNPTLKLFTNTAEMLLAIKERVSREPSRYFRIGTGEVIDSLVFDELTDSTLELVPFFGSLPNAALELKTKTNSVDNLVLVKDQAKGQTVVSWSINAKVICDNEEKMTASFEERVEAMAKVQEAGYRIGLHFDPLIHFNGWEDGYSEAVKDIFKVVNPERVAWISVSTLRYKPEMQETMETRFEESKIPYGEQFLAKDGKVRYLQPLRLKMTNFVWQRLKEVSSTLPTYMCMETPAAWRKVAGKKPLAGEELREVFARDAGKGRGRLLEVVS